MHAAAVQVFVDQNRQWPRRDLPLDELRQLGTLLRQHDLPGYVHVPYLANVATADALLRARSIDMVARSLRASALAGIRAVIVHPGSHLGRGFDAVREHVVLVVAEAWRGAGARVPLLLENMAGGGGQIGARLEELAALVAALRAADVDAGVCLDFAHAHGAGWDLAHASGVARLENELRETGVMRHIRLVHANDSRAAAGSHRDLHANPGAGSIGARGFRALARIPELARVPWILEVPGEEHSGPRKEDVLRLREIVDVSSRERAIRGSKSPAPGPTSGRRRSGALRRARDVPPRSRAR
jgi:deoxyribonuclease-4